MKLENIASPLLKFGKKIIRSLIEFPYGKKFFPAWLEHQSLLVRLSHGRFGGDVDKNQAVRYEVTAHPDDHQGEVPNPLIYAASENGEQR